MGIGVVILSERIRRVLETAVRERTKATTVVRWKRLQSRERLADVCLLLGRTRGGVNASRGEARQWD
jgi:hypothetical protein